MHVRRGQRHVAQRGRAELAHVIGVARQLADTDVVGRIRAAAIQVVQPGVVKALFGQRQFLVADVVGEGEAAMAVVTLHLFAKEQRFAALGRCADGVFLTAVLVAVIRAVKRQQAALKAAERFGQGAERIQRLRALACLGREGIGKQFAVTRIGLQACKQLFLTPRHAHLDRVLAKQRHQGLHLQRGQVRVGPGEHGQVRHIGQRHGASAAKFLCHAFRQSPPIGEGFVLVVAAGARHAVVGRQALVIKQVPPQLDLGRAHGVVGRLHRAGHPCGQPPVVRLQGAAAEQHPAQHQSGPQHEGARQTLHGRSALGHQALRASSGHAVVGQAQSAHHGRAIGVFQKAHAAG